MSSAQSRRYEAPGPITPDLIDDRRPRVPLDFAAATSHPGDAEFAASFTNACLRAAVRNNLVTFPSQTAWFRGGADGDVNWRIVQLYFVSGWPIQRICQRYQLAKSTVYCVLNKWRRRAIAAGLVQQIQPSSPESQAQGTFSIS
jgi:hypothetical protein